MGSEGSAGGGCAVVSGVGLVVLIMIAMRWIQGGTEVEVEGWTEVF